MVRLISLSEMLFFLQFTFLKQVIIPTHFFYLPCLTFIIKIKRRILKVLSQEA